MKRVFVILLLAFALVSCQRTIVDKEAVREALDSGHGYVIDCAIHMDEMVRPMVGGGSAITKFMIC